MNGPLEIGSSAQMQNRENKPADFSDQSLGSESPSTLDATAQAEVEGAPRPEEQPREDEEVPPEIEQAKKDKARREVRASDVDLILHWLITDAKAAAIDEHFLALFEQVMEERGEGSPDSIDETKELISHFGELFAQFDQQVERLAVNKAEYSKIKSKQIEIKTALCLSVINGHFAAKDIPQMVTGIEVISAKSPGMTATVSTLGYEPVAGWEKQSGKIIVFQEALADSYESDGKNFEIDFQHSIVHELSHPFTERYLVHNEKLYSLCDKLIDGDPALIELMPQHVRNAINSLENVDAQFPILQKIQPGVTKKQYVEFRRNRVKAEIITDFTALYLKSDGSLEHFIEKCLKLVDKDTIDKTTGIHEWEINELYRAQGVEKKEKIEEFKKKHEVFSEVISTWQVFHNEIGLEVSANKGKVTSHLELLGQEEEEEDDEEWFDWIGGYYEPAQDFAKPVGGGNKQESVWSNFAGLMKAMADEAPKIEETIGK